MMRREWFARLRHGHDGAHDGPHAGAHHVHRGLDTFLGVIAAAALITTIGTAAAASTGHAEPGGSLSVSGPSVLTQDASFALTSTSTTKVCRVQESSLGAADTTAPFSLPVSLSALTPGTHQLDFVSVDCSGYRIASVTKTITVPVQVKQATPFWVAPDSSAAADHQLALSVDAQSAPVTATIRRGSATIATLPTRSTTRANWTWTPGSAAAGRYTVAITSGGTTVTVPFGVARGWAQLAPTFPRCTTLTWSYVAKGQPARASGMERDIASAFTRITSATGIRFKHQATGGRITLSWKHLSDGADGEGGPTSVGGVATRGNVWFNLDSDWVGRPGFGHDAFGNPARGGLITHEVGHVLGLQHVTDRHQIMYPVASTGSPTELAQGDRAGLNALYNAKAC